MKKRSISLLLALVMLFSILPVQAFAAAEPEYLTETEIDEQYISDGAFYLVSAEAEISEKAGHGYLLGIRRWGEGNEAQSVRLVMTDVTASYGEDYKVKLYNSSLFDERVQNADESESVLGYLASHEQEEYNYTDALIDGTITAEDQLTEEEANNIELSDEEKQAMEDSFAAMLGLTNEEEEAPEAKTEVTASGALSLAEARAQATGLADDREAVTYTLPEEDNGLLSDSIGYMQDSILKVSEELNSAYLVIDFAEGITEKYIEIIPDNNKKSDGDRQSSFMLDSVDGSEVSGMYGSFTLKILDDEPYVPASVEFSSESYEPENGYITVKIVRTGGMESVLTVMLYSADDTAIGGVDYSPVNTKVSFGFGIRERTVKIPVVSENIKKTVGFGLYLSDPVNCAIGGRSEAYCTVSPSDYSFAALTSNNSKGLLSAANSSGTLVGAVHDMSLKDVITSDGLLLWDIKNGAGGSDGFISNDPNNPYGVHVQYTSVCNALYEAAFNVGNHFDWSGFQLSWQLNRGSMKLKFIDNDDRHWRRTDSDSEQTFEYLDPHKGQTNWDNRVDNVFFKSTIKPNKLIFQMTNDKTAGRGTQQSIDIASVKPILRPFKIDLVGAAPFMLIDSSGNKVPNDEIAAYNRQHEVELCNADSKNSVVTTTGNYLTVQLKNQQNPICYISAINLVDPDTGNEKTIIEFPEGTTSASFELTNDLIKDNFSYKGTSYVKFKDNGDCGLYGYFQIRPVLSNMPAMVTVKADDRVDITVWDGEIIPYGTRYEETMVTEYEIVTLNGVPRLLPVQKLVRTEVNGYQCSVGDSLRFNVNVKDEYKGSYNCDQVRIKTVRPAGQQDYEIDLQPGKSYAQDIAKGTELEISPVVTRGQNLVILRVPKGDKDLLISDIFNDKSIICEETASYYEYLIASDRVVGKTFELTARTANENKVPVWYTEGHASTQYSQETFYFTGTSNSTDNIVYLTVPAQNAYTFSIAGKVYYDDAVLGGVTSAGAWYPASGALYIIDDEHYGIADLDGSIRTLAFRGINGKYVRVKIATAGYEDYMDVYLEGLSGIENVMNISDHIISEANMRRPHITSVVVKDPINQTYGKVSISTNPASTDPAVFTVTVNTTNPDTNAPYTYTYTDQNGVTQTTVEKPVGVDLLVYDPVTHELKFTISGATANEDKTSWTVSQTFTLGEENHYRPGDLIYARLITDRMLGDGCAENENGVRVPVEAFSTTTYAPVRTGLTFTGTVERVIDPVTIKLENEYHNRGLKNFELPVIGNLTTIINAAGLSFGGADTENGYRLFLGVQLKSLTKGNHFDGNGKPVSDTGFAIDSSNFRKGLSEMCDEIRDLGSKNAIGAQSLGVPAWSIVPMAGIWLEFSYYYDAEDPESGKRLVFTGGGGYLGVIGSFRYTYYMCIYGVPVYVGGDVSVTLLAELGIEADEDKYTSYYEPDQNFIDDLLYNKTHFEFLFRALVVANAYAGIGICGTLGVRGGFTLTLSFIANPMMAKRLSNVNSTGVEVTGALKFWFDLVLFSIPKTVETWDFYKWGYFKDIENLPLESAVLTQGLLAEEEVLPIESKPRSEEASLFHGDKHFLSSTFKGMTTRTIVYNAYDDAQQKLIALGNGKILMVYLDDDKDRTDGERTVLYYSLFDIATNEWTAPVAVQDDETADFAPALCDMGDKVLITWVSRAEAANTNNYAEYLSKNEIYTVMMDKETLTLGKIERLTDDAFSDTAPVAVSNGKDALVIYQKSEVGTIENGNQLLNAAMPYTNNSVLAYMLYDGETETWVRDKFFENEVAFGADTAALLEQYKGQRFVPTAAFGQENPVMADFTASSGRIDIGTGENSEYKGYGIFAYTVDGDNDLATGDDRELFVQLYDYENHSTGTAIRITDNAENDCNPQLVCSDDQAYLFWLHDGEEINYINVEEIIRMQRSSNGISAGVVSIPNDDDEVEGLSVNDYKVFVDKSQNIFVAWSQNTASLEQNSTSYKPTQDIYLSGMVQTPTSNPGEFVATWSYPIQMTGYNESKLLNEHPEFADLGEGRLMMVHNCSDLDMSGDLYSERSVALVEDIYRTVSSLEIADVVSKTVPWNAGDEFNVNISLKNTGVKSEPNFKYKATLMLGDEILEEREEKFVDESVLAGRSTVVSESFVLPEKAVGRLDELKIKVVATEANTEESSESIMNLFDSTMKFAVKSPSAVQDGDYFVVSGFVSNIGVIEASGSERVEITDVNDPDTVLAYAEVKAVASEAEMPFELKVAIDKDSAKYGHIDYIITVRGADGASLSEPEIVTGSLTSAFGLHLTGVKDPQILEIKKGQTIKLDAVYEPAAFFRNAEVSYAVDNMVVAQLNGSELTGVSEGETTLRMTASPFGGNNTVTVIVTDGGDDPDDMSYDIKIPFNIRNGSVEVSPKNAYADQTVTVKVTPDKGFTLETLTVLNGNGKELEVKNLGSNEYSFKMPSGNVTVNATFMEDNTMLNFFVDVPAAAYYYDAVLWAAENSITKGTDEVHFSPNEPVTRAQVVTFLWRAAGRPDPTGDASRFVDVPANEYYAKAVAWAIEQGITKGTSATTFTPDAVCTRAQIVTFLSRFAGVEDADTASVFSDVKSTDYFAAAVKWAKDNDVTEGTSATTFSPNEDCTRAQAVTFLYRWMVR